MSENFGIFWLNDKHVGWFFVEIYRIQIKILACVADVRHRREKLEILAIQSKISGIEELRIGRITYMT